MSKPRTENGAIYVLHLNLRVSYAPRQFEPGWKVGFTQNLPARVGSLMGCHGGALVAVALGTREDEARFHYELSALRVLGGPWGIVGSCREWFYDRPEFGAWLETFPAAWRGEIAHRHKVAPRLRALWAELTSGRIVGPQVTAYLLSSGTPNHNELRAACSAVVTERCGDAVRLRVVGNTAGGYTAKTGIEVVVSATTGRQIESAGRTWWQVDGADLTALRAFDTRDDVRRTKGAA